MWTRVLIGIGLFLLGYYVGKQVERDAPTRDWLRQRREEKEQEAISTEKNEAPPATGEQ